MTLSNNRKLFKAIKWSPSGLTVVVDGVDEPDTHVGVVVRHQHDVEQLLAQRVQLPQASVHRLQSLSETRRTSQRRRDAPKQTSAPPRDALTLTKGKAGPGAKGSFSCSIWYLRYSSTPCSSYTFCSRSVRNKTREETATVTAFSGFGWREEKKKEKMVLGQDGVKLPRKYEIPANQRVA
ncbi:hypothetical protein EYF80_030348 [Liparis tanakae]|uniref:Uncharacterized protein n=1 Tax=Liparis tanakae TaxID=230148 RepID=A0A4Z2H2X0_9TELE|nr:hypothetical protein EYF80_030348 [Liparis tanakae]